MRPIFVLFVFLWITHQYAIASFISRSKKIMPRSFYLQCSVSVQESQSLLIDGAEWTSLFRVLQKEQEGKGYSQLSPKFGRCTVVTGTDNSGRRCVGMMKVTTSNTSKNKNEILIDPASVAFIPDGVSDANARAGFVHALTAIHPLLTGLQTGVDNIGGGSDAFQIQKQHIVVVGGNERALSIAQTLAAYRATTNISRVTVVTTKSGISLPNEKIRIVQPAVGEMELEFCEALGKFDAIIDCVGNEFEDKKGTGESPCIRLLRERHGCDTYTSCLRQAQQIVNDEGVLFGPGAANKHTKRLEQQSGTARNKQDFFFASPEGLGETVQEVLNTGVDPSRSKESWSLQDFWEFSTWPRGEASDTRFGLPTLEEKDLNIGWGDLEDDAFDEEGQMISTPLIFQQKMEYETESQQQFDDEENYYDDEDIRSGSRSMPKPKSSVISFEGLAGMQNSIVEEGKTVCLFLTAPYCRVCRKLSPLYQRMARLDESEIVYMTASAGGETGKALRRALEVRAVPAFVFFREGKRYGKVLGIPRLPSKKLNLAIQLLQSGEKWDDEAFRELDRGEQKR